jgi:V/A-type H+-transporting ATPase subunit E
MSLDGLKKAVLDKARADAREILQRAAAQAAALTAAAEKDASAAAAEIVDAAQRKAEEIRMRAVSGAQREARMKLLGERNRILDEVFERAYDVLKKEDIAALYAKELQSMDLTGAVILVPPRDKAQFEKIIAGTEAVVEADAGIDAGCIVVREDFRIDRTLRSLLAEALEDMQADIARTLFSEDK